MFSVKPCIYTLEKNRELKGFLIYSEDYDISYLFYVNRFLHRKAYRSKNTARQYAYRVKNWLEWLESRGLDYRTAAEKDIVSYLRSLQFDISEDHTSIAEMRISVESLQAIYTPVKAFYVELYKSGIETNVTVKMVENIGTTDYLSGIVSRIEKADILIEDAFDRSPEPREYIRWYTEDQKDAIFSNFNTIRDKAIFSISLDGMRIDEILSCSMGDYDPMTGLLTPYRSKGKADGSELRSCLLSERSRKYLEDYLLNERQAIENDLFYRGKKPDNALFIGIKKGARYGRTLGYNSFLKTLKRCAKRGGLDPKLIRTHSGRSTAANEAFRERAKDPNSWSDKEILEQFAWASMESSEPYQNHADPETLIERHRKMEQLNAERRKRYGKHDTDSSEQ